MKDNTGFNKKNNKPHYDKPQSRAVTPIRMPSRKGQNGGRRGSK